MPHQIRLAGPWEVCRDGQNWQRCALPQPQTTEDLTSDMQLRRRFHRPTGLDEKSVVNICVTASSCLNTLWLNDRPLSAEVTQKHDEGATSIFQVTQDLIEFNVLLLKSASGESPDLPTINAVVLQIED